LAPIKQIQKDAELRKRIAEACGISRQAVDQWKEVPPRRVKAVAKVLGFTDLPHHELYPRYLKPTRRFAKPAKKSNGTTKASPS
jgi:hypothetical protein